MPIYIVARCFSCEMFQVIQKPKSKKFKCRMCNEKQSVRKIYCSSDKAKDCRIVVQQYNKKYGEMIDEARQNALQKVIEHNEHGIDDCDNQQSYNNNNNNSGSYMETGCNNDNNNNNYYYDNQPATPQHAQKQPSQWDEYLSDDDGAKQDISYNDENNVDEDKYVFEVPSRKKVKKKRKRAINDNQQNLQKQIKSKKTNNSRYHSNDSFLNDNNFSKAPAMLTRNEYNGNDSDHFNNEKLMVNTVKTKRGTNTISNIYNVNSRRPINTQNNISASNYNKNNSKNNNNNLYKKIKRSINNDNNNNSDDSITSKVKKTKVKSQWDDFLSDDDDDSGSEIW